MRPTLVVIVIVAFGLVTLFESHGIGFPCAPATVPADLFSSVHHSQDDSGAGGKEFAAAVRLKKASQANAHAQTDTDVLSLLEDSLAVLQAVRLEMQRSGDDIAVITAEAEDANRLAITSKLTNMTADAMSLRTSLALMAKMGTENARYVEVVKTFMATADCRSASTLINSSSLHASYSVSQSFAIHREHDNFIGAFCRFLMRVLPCCVLLLYYGTPLNYCTVYATYAGCKVIGEEEDPILRRQPGQRHVQ